MAITDTPVDNGVNVQALLEARDALTAAPEAAQFTWRATNTWVNGTHSQSSDPSRATRPAVWQSPIRA